MHDNDHRGTLAKRMARIGTLVQLALLLVAAGYWQAQVAEGSYYRRLADNNRLRKLEIASPRGRIVDRHGEVLAENVPRYALELDRSLVDDDAQSKRFASTLLELSPEDIDARVEAHRGIPAYKPIVLERGLKLETVARFRVHHLEHPEFEIAVEQRRLYRHAHQTAHLLGYLGEVTRSDLEQAEAAYRAGDLIGKRGIEQYYDAQLRGDGGERVVVVDSHGRLIEELDRSPANAGSSLRTTIDLPLQQQAMALLADKVGAIVALDPSNGDVLALASSPSFDPNRFARRLSREEWKALVDHPYDPLQNRALQSRYPPGSVFKMVMTFAALQELGASPNERVYCRGYSVIYNHRYRCWNAAGHGWVDLSDAIKYSCNVYFHQIGQKLGIDPIAKWARRFGLGSKTGIDLGGEQAGLVPDTTWSLERRGSPWYAGETISVATGQGPILVTPLQIAVMTAAVANGGTLVRPRLRLDRPVERTEPDLALDPNALARLRDGLRRVVMETDGTGRAARVDGLEIAGKTGTAQVVRQATWTANIDLAPEQRDHAWFASWAPYDDPRLIVVVFIEHGGAGSSSAAPLAKKLYETFFDADLTNRPAA